MSTHYKTLFPKRYFEKYSNFRGIILRHFILVENKKLKSKLFDKGDPLPFSIVCMVYLDSNIPLNVYYVPFGFDILRFGRTTSKKNV